MKNQDKGSLKAQGIVEYALILALVIGVSFLGLEATGTSVSEVFCMVLDGLKFPSQYCNSAYCESSFDSMDGWESAAGYGWEVVNGKLCNTSNPYRGYLYNQCSMENLPKDYTVHLNGATLDKGNGYGIFFRLQDYDDTPNGYAFQYDPGYAGGAYVVRKWVNGYEINPPIVANRMSGYDWLDSSRDVELQVKGDTFTAFVDGEQVMTFTDPNYESGGVGLRTWDSTAVCMDDFRIEPLR